MMIMMNNDIIMIVMILIFLSNRFRIPFYRTSKKRTNDRVRLGAGLTLCSFAA